MGIASIERNMEPMITLIKRSYVIENMDVINLGLLSKKGI
jgi:hypothetical protein